MPKKTNFILNELKVTRKVDTGSKFKCSDCFRSQFVLLQKSKNARLKDGVGALKVLFYIRTTQRANISPRTVPSLPPKHIALLFQHSRTERHTWV